ncbi:MAG: hypothetical protein AB8B82_17155 [Roseovarius sp.]
MKMALTASLLALATSAQAMTDVDLDNMISLFEGHCLNTLIKGEIPNDDGFRLLNGEAGFGYSGSVTKDDRIVYQQYEDRGLWGCGTENSVFSIPADGAHYPRLQARLNAFADRFAQNDAFVETSACLPQIEGSWGRSFVSVSEARPGTYLSIVVSSTQTYSNGGPSLQEHYGPLPRTCEETQ